MFSHHLALLSLLIASSLTHAFTFNFTSPLSQCANTTVQWAGGSAPYKILLIPTGEIHPEIRTIADHAIPSGSENSFSFPIDYPENSTFVAVMSDAEGFGSGGTTPVMTVTSSQGSKCLRKTQVTPEFFIFTNPAVPQECSPMEISYNAGANPPVDIFVVIPGGSSSRIESGSPNNSSFEWIPTLQNGTQLMIVAGDTLGAGKGGSTDILTVASGNSSCVVQAGNNTTSMTASSAPSATQSSDAIPRLSLSLSAVVCGLLFFVIG